MHTVVTFLPQASEFFMFASLMAVDMVIFAIMAYYYKYVDFTQREKDKKEEVRVELIVFDFKPPKFKFTLLITIRSCVCSRGESRTKDTPATPTSEAEMLHPSLLYM